MREMWLLTATLSAPVAIMMVFGADSYASRKSEPVLPVLSQDAMAGQADFVALCSSCHGRYGEGSERGPDLLGGDAGAGLRSEGETVRDVFAPATDDTAYASVHGAPPSDGRPLDGRRVSGMMSYLREMQAANRPGD